MPNLIRSMVTPHTTDLRQGALPAQSSRNTLFDGYRFLLWLAILGYTILFAYLAFNQHLGMRTHKADLGQIDQAIWNSSHGRFVEMTDTGIIASRLTDHVEPILALISPVFWLWNDVRALLLLQVLLVAIGTWPLYELVLLQLDQVLSPRERTQVWQVEPLRQMTRPIALALALAYLLAPQLQSAVLTEFHAAPLAVPFILWAFWAIATARLWPFVIAALLVAATKEEMALLAAGLGVWRFWMLDVRFWITARHPEPSNIQNLTSNIITLAVTLIALIWFYLATFVIVPAHAPQIYDSAESVYFGRYGALGDSPADIFKSFFTQPELVWQIATEPARVAYLWGLLAPFGLLSLFAPEVLLLSLPLLLANLLSAYPAQYYGEFHYSAPLVPYVAVSAAYGLGRLWRWLGRQAAGTSASYQHMAAAGIGTMTLVSLFTNARTALRPLLALTCTVWLLGWGTWTYWQAGRGPFAARYDPTPITAHHHLLARFVAQLPPAAAVTATAAVHPHVSHRRYVYQFPLGLPELDKPGQADWALLDVTTNTDMAPGDLKGAVDTLLAGDWGVVDGADGFLLLRRGAESKVIPDAFYAFARGKAAQDAMSASTPLTFIGAQAEDWPRWRQTWVNGCWQVGPTFPSAPVTPQLEIITPAGDLLYSFSAAAPPAMLWYPPARWQPGEVICVKTLALSLPKRWGVRVAPAEEQTVNGMLYAQSLLRSAEGTALVQLFERTAHDGLQQIQPELIARDAQGERTPSIVAQGDFVNEDQALRVTVWSPSQVQPGVALTLRLVWSGKGFTDWPASLVAFVHVRQGETRVAQADGPPRFFHLGTNEAGGAVDHWLEEWRQLALPPTIVAEQPLTIAVGLYDPVSGERSELQQSIQGRDNELQLAAMVMGTAPVPDQACALLPATCASQPAR